MYTYYILGRFRFEVERVMHMCGWMEGKFPITVKTRNKKGISPYHFHTNEMKRMMHEREMFCSAINISTGNQYVMDDINIERNLGDGKR